MFGVIIACHGNLGKEFLNAVEMIVGKVENMASVSIDAREDVNDIKDKIAKAIKSVDKGEGVLLLTDMFGGTPSNIGLSFLTTTKIEVITGVNLPMLIKLATYQDGKTLDELAEFIKEYGQRNISLASEILKKKLK